MLSTMSYFLQALIGSGPALTSGAARFKSASVVPLAQGLALIPLTERLYEDIGSENIADGFDKLSDAVREWAQSLSRTAPVAYVEAEFFGGSGSQSAVAWSQGKPVLLPVHAVDAINRALQALGVQKGAAHDEFAALGLDRHRRTEEWQAPPAEK
jgi:hypothetical protein